jgi:hypothetical protein
MSEIHYGTRSVRDDVGDDTIIDFLVLADGQGV